VHNRRSASFFLRRFALSLLPVTIPLVVLGAVSIYVTDNFVNREILAITTRQLGNLKDTLDLTVFDLDALNLTFSSNTTLINSVDRLLGRSSVNVEDVYLARLVGDLLNAQINARPYVYSVYFYLDRHPSRFIATDMGIVQTTNFPDIDWLKTYEATPVGRLLWTQAREMRVSWVERNPRHVFTMYRRLFPAVTGRSGVIVVNMSKDYFDDLIAQAALNQGQEVDLIGQDGNLVLTTNKSGELGALGASIRHTDIDRLSKRSIDGKDYYVYSSLTGRYGWRLISIIPASRLNRLPQTLRTLIFVLLLLSILLGALLTYSMARRNSERVRSVVQLFRTADSGEEIIETPEPGNDEYDYMIETLIRSFLKQRYVTLQLSERQARAEILELRALRSQVNPHFLFNTLDSLYWMVYGTEGVPSRASSMIKDLSSLLRYSLEDTEQVVLADEIENAKRYVAIQQYRYRGKFRVSWNTAEDTLRHPALKLVLQPFIENAIYHGIRNAKGKKSIEVSSYIDPDARTLHMMISDDGAGMTEERLREVQLSLVDDHHPADHIGVYNTHRRIQLSFGARFGVSISSSPDRGTRVEITLPA